MKSELKIKWDNLKNKLSKRLLPVEIIKGSLSENESIFNNNIEIGKVLINENYPFALVKFLDNNFENNKILKCEHGSLKIIAPQWLNLNV